MTCGPFNQIHAMEGTQHLEGGVFGGEISLERAFAVFPTLPPSHHPGQGFHPCLLTWEGGKEDWGVTRGGVNPEAEARLSG